MWLHICLLGGISVLAVLAAMGRLPRQDILAAQEWRVLFLLLATGDCLGGWGRQL